jgi:hypothetical protein
MEYLSISQLEVYNTPDKVSMPLVMAIIMDGYPDRDGHHDDIENFHDQKAPVDFRGLEIMRKDLIQSDPVDHTGRIADEAPDGLPVAQPERREKEDQKKDANGGLDDDPSELVHGATSCDSRVGPSVGAPDGDRFYR